MSKQKAIEGIYRTDGFHWVGDGFRVTNYFPSNSHVAERINPYILLDYHPPYQYPPSKDAQKGVGVHPHRGFETVTIAFEGSVAHHDSGGNSGIIGPGDVQWMTAARGVLHKEYHSEEFSRKGGTMHMAQIWVNLPKAHKMDPPGYQAITADQIAVFPLPDHAGEVRVIAGSYAGVKGPARTFTPINMFDIRLRPQGAVHLSFPADQNTAMLVLHGQVKVNGARDAGALDFVLFENEGEDILVEASNDAHLLVLNGQPINEPVVQSGPFVMNTAQEIREAIQDFRNGTFGSLEN